MDIIIIPIIIVLLIVVIPRLRQSLDDLDKKYEEKNKWKQNIDQHYNGHHNQVNSFGYQNYKYNNYED